MLPLKMLFEIDFVDQVSRKGGGAHFRLLFAIVRRVLPSRGCRGISLLREGRTSQRICNRRRLGLSRRVQIRLEPFEGARPPVHRWLKTIPVVQSVTSAVNNDQ